MKTTKVIEKITGQAGGTARSMRVGKGALIFSFVLLAALFFGMAVNDGEGGPDNRGFSSAADVSVADYASLTAAITAAGTTPTVIEMTGDITVPANNHIYIVANQDITLVSASSSVPAKLIGANNIATISIANSGKLTIGIAEDVQAGISAALGIIVTHAEGELGRGIDSDGTLIMNSGEVSGNTYDYGAGIHAHTGSATISGTAKIIKNTAVGDNTTSGNGGGIFVGDVIFDNSFADLIVDGDAVISGNKAEFGAGIALGKGSVTISDNVQITDNKAAIREGDNPLNLRSANGGGIYVYSATAHDSVLIMSGNVLVSGNSADVGAGIYVANEEAVIFGNVEIKNNSATIEKDYGYGGGLYISGAKVTISDNVKITENTAPAYGGGIFLTGAASVLEIDDDVLISGNEATSQQGGGLYVAGGRTTINGGTISENKARLGGGIYMTGATTVLMLDDDALVSKNSATGNGHGVYVNAGTATINGIISENKVKEGNPAGNGGGLYTNGGTVTINGTISKNEAAFGGGIFMGNGTVNLNGTISENKATNSGGGIYLRDGTLTLNGTISENEAVYQGGIRVYQDPDDANDFSHLYLPAGNTATFSGNKSSQMAVATALPTTGNWAGTIASTSIDGWTLTGETKRLVDEFAETNDVRSLIVFNNYDISFHTEPFSFEVSFELNGGTPEIEPVVLFEGGAVSKPADPTRAGYSFGGWYVDDDTFSQAYNFSAPVTANITLYAMWYFTVSGTVTDGTDGLSGVTITYTGGLSAGPITTGTNGEYSIQAPAGNTITISGVTTSGYLLNPADQAPQSRTVTDAAVNFVMTALFTVSGTVTDGVNALPGVSIAYTGGLTSGPVTTGPSGEYSIQALSGDTVTISGVTLSGYLLNPADQAPQSRTVTDAAVNFVMTALFTVSGTVSDGTNGLSGASITYTGGLSSGPITTGPAGEYSIQALSGDTVTITGVTLSGYLLNPADQVPQFRTATDNAVDFVMTAAFTVSGTVTDGTNGLLGVSISYTEGLSSGQVTTGQNGEYSIQAYVGNVLEITGVTLSGYRLNPSGQVPQSRTATDPNVDFVMHVLEVWFNIKATADSGAKISPAGDVSVLREADQTFTFSSLHGNAIVSVIVDNARLTPDQIALGYYTFTNVLRPHSIHVESEDPAIIVLNMLNITVGSGSGKALYSMDGVNFTEYTSAVPIPSNISVTVRADADDGYAFKEWRNGDEIYTTSEVTFNNVTSSLYLSVYFGDESYGPLDDDDSLWYIIGGILLLLAGILLWFFLFYRRYYGVVLMDPSGVAVLEDRVHRKSEYNFIIEGEHGAVTYLVGDEEEQEPKVLLPNPDGSYTIPKGEAVDKVTIRYT